MPKRKKFGTWKFLSLGWKCEWVEKDPVLIEN
jgi:hypothetical protein